MKSCNKVSVVIPLYNAEKYIETCIRSVCRQTYANLEILLIDDGSEDQSESICRKCMSLDQRIQYIRKEHSGVSDTRNMGIRAATGEYITFLDADDVLDRNFVRIMVQTALQYPKMLIVSEFVLFYSEETELKERRAIKETGVEICENVDAVLLGLRNGYIGGKLFDRELMIHTAVAFQADIHACEDMLFVIEYLVKGKVGAVAVGRSLYFYRQYGESAGQYSRSYLKTKTRLEANKKMRELLEAENYPQSVLEKLRESYAKSKIDLCFDYFHDCHVRQIRPDREEIRGNMSGVDSKLLMSKKDRIKYVFLRCTPGMVYSIWELKQYFKGRRV